jgi:hypothetical protein
MIVCNIISKFKLIIIIDKRIKYIYNKKRLYLNSIEEIVIYD